MLIRCRNLRFLKSEKVVACVISNLNVKAIDTQNHLNLIMKLYQVSQLMTTNKMISKLHKFFGITWFTN